MTHYIPDLTERYPEGFRGFDEPDCGYEPPYSEQLITDPNYQDSLMELVSVNPDEALKMFELYKDKMVMSDFDRLRCELIVKGLVFNNAGYSECEEVQELYAICPWGYILSIDSVNMMHTAFELYDNNHQLICTMHSDDDQKQVLVDSIVLYI